GGWGGKGPPIAAVYDSEEERLAELRPDTGEAALMEKRKRKAQKLIGSKMEYTLNPRKRYEQRKEVRLYEKRKEATALAIAKEDAKAKEEIERMFAEERRTWDAYELNTRNHIRMVNQAREDRKAVAVKIRRAEEDRLTQQEEGLSFNNGIVVGYRRWRASPALAAVLPAHPCPAHALNQSADARWVLSGGDDRIVRLWDTEAFERRLTCSDEKRAAHTARRAGGVAADVALGWECVRELTGHNAAIRDVAFNPRFEGPPWNGQRETEAGKDAGKESTSTAADAPARLEHMLASASADLTLRIWDLSFNPRIPRYTLRGHRGVVYGCRFEPSGLRLASCSADGTVRLWDVLQKHRAQLLVPKSVLHQCKGNPCPSKAVSEGFSLSVTLIKDTGKDVRTEEYYQGCKLVLRARGLKRFTGLFVAGVSAEGLWESFDVIFTHRTQVGKRFVPARETVWVTLREAPSPTPSSRLTMSALLKPRKRNFDTVARTQLFAQALKVGDWIKAAMMLSGSVKLDFGKVKVVGASEGKYGLLEELKGVLGKNVIVENGASRHRRRRHRRDHKGGCRSAGETMSGDDEDDRRTRSAGDSVGNQRSSPRVGLRRRKGSRSRRRRRRRKRRHSWSSAASSESDEDPAVRAAAEKRVITELKRLKSLRAAGVKALGEATGALALARVRKRESNAKNGEGGKDLLQSAGIAIKDPQAGLKVLVWDGCFGADLPEIRMPLPEYYPSSSVPYDQNEDVGARAMEEATAVGEGVAQAMMEEMQAENESETDAIRALTNALLKREQRLRQVATRRRDAMGTPWGLAASFLPPALRMAPVTSGVDGREGLPSLVHNEFHRMLEGTANRERREKAAEQMLKRAPPQ
ncbi:unnamed protein product, partial [Sphacelaria rigidula]